MTSTKGNKVLHYLNTSVMKLNKFLHSTSEDTNNFMLEEDDKQHNYSSDVNTHSSSQLAEYISQLENELTQLNTRRNYMTNTANPNMQEVVYLTKMINFLNMQIANAEALLRTNQQESTMINSLNREMDHLKHTKQVILEGKKLSDNVTLFKQLIAENERLRKENQTIRVRALALDSMEEEKTQLKKQLADAQKVISDRNLKISQLEQQLLNANFQKGRSHGNESIQITEMKNALSIMSKELDQERDRYRELDNKYKQLTGKS